MNGETSLGIKTLLLKYPLLSKYCSLTSSAYDDSLHTENHLHHDEVFISQHVNSQKQDLTNSSVHGPLIQYTCSTFTIHLLHPQNQKNNQNPLQNTVQQNIQLEQNENVNRRDQMAKQAKHK